MRRHHCRLEYNEACNCCKCRGKCEDDCNRFPTDAELIELRNMLPILRRLISAAGLK